MELKIVVYLAPEQLETLKGTIEKSFAPKRKRKKPRA